MSSSFDRMLRLEKDHLINNLPRAGNVVRQEPYMNNFLSLSDTQIPDSPIQIFKWCKYFYMFDPLIAGAINALASFPVTEVFLEDYEKDVVKEVRDSDGEKIQLDVDGNEVDSEEESDMLKDYKRVIIDKLGIHKLMIEIGIDYFLYGNCFIFGEMEKKGKDGKPEWRHVTRLDPSKMIIDYNPATGKKIYRWEVPQNIRNIVNNKKPVEEYNKIPQIIKDAVRKNETVVLKSSLVYHFQRATDSMGDNTVWGTPIVANVMKLLIYRNTLRRAQEAIAREHIVPLRVYYLQPTPDVDPLTDYSATAHGLAQQLQMTVNDPNHKIVSPLPVNMLSVGGQGRALMVTQEIEQIQGEILAGMNVPREFIFGGVSYSGSSISLRILENQFVTYRLLLKDFLQTFLIGQMALARNDITSLDDEDVIRAKMTDLKMQDDVQQKQLMVQLNGAGKVSNEELWKALGLDPVKMRQQLDKEAIQAMRSQANMQKAELEMRKANMDTEIEIQKKEIDMQMEIQKYQQMKEQEMMMEMQMEAMQAGVDPSMMGEDPGMMGVDPSMMGEDPEMMGEEPSVAGDENLDYGDEPMADEPMPEDDPEESPLGGPTPEEAEAMEGISVEAQRLAVQIHKLDESFREEALSKTTPTLRPQVEQALEILDQLEEAKKSMEVDMRPMPEQKPPRREGGV